MMAGVFLTGAGAAAQFAQAARHLAWFNGLDCDTMERLARKIERRARSSVIEGAIRLCANDDGSDDG